MFFLRYSIVASTIVAAATLSKPAEKVSSFIINQVPRKCVKHGATAYLKSMRKWNGSAERIANLTSRALAPGSVTAVPTGLNNTDEEYDSLVTIGNQTFTLDLDSGSSDLWVFGPSLSGEVGSYHTIYNPGPSAKVQKGETWSIRYGDLSFAEGTVYNDVVSIGGVKIYGQIVEMAEIVSEAFLSGTNDGIVGLAFDSINQVLPNQAATFLTNAIKQGLPQALFTANLKHQAPGCYTFGTINAGEHSGAITYTSVNTSDGQWMFTPAAYSVGSGPIISPNATSLRGIADTGTTIMLLDTSVVEAYYAKVRTSRYSNEAGGYIFGCNDTLPDLAFFIGSYRAVVPGSYMLYTTLDDGISCYGGLQDDAGIGFGIYGDAFLKSQFVVFDRTTQPPRLGFAPKA